MALRWKFMRVLALGIAIIGIGLLSAASAEAQSGAWTPRCEGPKSTNCYIWLLNPNNGLYDHIYQGGPPNCSKGPPGGYDPSQNPACEARGGNTPSGNGGPNDTSNNSPSFKIANGKYWVRWRPGDPHYGGNLTEDRYIDPNDKSKGQRWVIVQNTTGFTELTVPQINKQGGVVNVTYRLRQSDVISEGANYYLVQFKQANNSEWQPMKPIRMVQVLRNTNYDGYTVYIGSPNLPSTPTEYWVP